MLTTMALAVAMAAQAKGVALDGVEQRRVYEATLAARAWAFEKAGELIPPSVVANERDPARRSFLMREAMECERTLRIAALHQVCKDYGLKPAVVQAIMADPTIALKHPHLVEEELAHLVNPDAPKWKRKPTKFRPDRVRLAPKAAKRFGYQNPDVDFNRRRPSQNLKDQLLGSPGPSPSPPSGGNR